jgi:hypothetical protein
MACDRQPSHYESVQEKLTLTYPLIRITKASLASPGT